MNGDDDDDSDTEKKSGHTHEEPNAKHTCTAFQCRNAATKKLNKEQRGNSNNNQKVVLVDESTCIGDHNGVTADANIINNEIIDMTHTHDYTTNSTIYHDQPQTQPTTPPWRRRRMTSNVESDGAIRDAAAAELVLDEDWIRIESNDTYKITTQHLLQHNSPTALLH